MPTRTAEATWLGGLKGGTGNFKGESGAVAASYSFGTRFESTKGSNPEELLAAAHAACFSMALSAELEKAGKPPTSVTTHAACTINKVGAGFKIVSMKLTTRAVVPNIDAPAFLQIAQGAKEGCPVSQALQGNLAIELDAKLE